MMEGQRRFIADAAHELRTPITALSLQAENLDPVDMPPAARDRVDALKRGMARTKRLLEQLMALARQDADICTIDERAFLDQVAKETVADLLPQASARGIDLGFKSAETVSVRIDPISLASVVRNLLENAIKFSPDGGAVDVTVRKEAEWALFQVEDAGPGIPVDDLERALEPFFRGHSKLEGSGLGLSIVKKIVDRHSGFIQLTNIEELGRSGLRAAVRLPCARS